MRYSAKLLHQPFHDSVDFSQRSPMAHQPNQQTDAYLIFTKSPSCFFEVIFSPRHHSVNSLSPQVSPKQMNRHTPEDKVIRILDLLGRLCEKLNPAHGTSVAVAHPSCQAVATENMSAFLDCNRWFSRIGGNKRETRVSNSVNATIP